MGRHTPAAGRHHRADERRSRSRFTRTRAALAGALVLGVGTSLTLAAWSDDEFGAASFAASTFVVESQTASSTWAAHEAVNPATLVFNATAMSPGLSQYAYIDIRTTSATNIGGTAALSAVTAATGTLLPALEYRVVATPTGTTCGASAFASQTYTASLAVGAAVPGASGALGTASATPVRFCFDVRVKAGTGATFQGGTASATWQFTSTSSS
ncbi:hypothetical protein [Plantibacter cousiniae (nom. nud.)]|uniref:SipW-cognate class signal peptide n=1 Tax=Plantibacter cousiniae (nom. nud.) TaxID=199709 RepID=A0ABY1LRX8_9MICO|nr:hypothetical protein [Plantibacter cousiniae]SKC70461.1 SipW-cognate class signal peptide [Plantibacter cousiniae]